mgnify:CR=1 FL=1
MGALIASEEEPVGWETRAEVGLRRIASRTGSKLAEYILIRYYLFGRTMKQIAKEMSLSESRVSQVHAETLKALQETLTNEGVLPPSRVLLVKKSKTLCRKVQRVVV